MTETNRIYSNRKDLLPLTVGPKWWPRDLSIQGGPYDSYVLTDNSFGVCVRKERATGVSKDVHVPIEDFSVPSPDDKTLRTGLLRAFEAAINGKDVYVGCMGGIGRTGLFMALMAKAAGVADPVAYVRKHYKGHAVETSQQKRFVEGYDVAEIRASLPRMLWRARLAKLMFWQRKTVK